ncbi:MAG: gliding motility-associated C-terminal domain-containing protein, partial [Bacteroidota bacterium]
MKMILKSIARRSWITGLVAVLLLVSNELYATHIRAGEIRIQRISATSLTYRFTVVAIRDSGGGQVPFGLGNFSFGDGRVIENVRDVAQRGVRDENGDLIVKSFEVTDLGDEQELNVFVVEHTYPSASPSYTLGYREENRNEGVLNLANSVNTAFFIDAELRIDPIFGINNSPVMTVLPIDRGGQFVAFFHNPGAFDPDGDSLSYKLVVPQQAEGTEASGYVDPNNARFYGDVERGNEAQDGRPTFELDPVTGTLSWDAPDQPGEYNIAFIVEEWRKIGGQWFKLGFVTRDMQIIIEETENERPEVMVPEDICVEAGTLVTGFFQGTDADGHDVLIEAFGGPFELLPSAEVSPLAFQNQPARVDFSWQTDCSHVRERPYEVIVKISDRPPAGPTLVAFETWQITVVGPDPTGVEADQINSETMNLSWDSYECPQADSLEVWRRVDSFEFEPEDCEIGMPLFAGYSLIDVIPARETSYVDNNNGAGLAAGAKYCYRLVARFPQPGGGLSYVSEEACDSLEAVRPIITNVDIESTSDTDGEIIVKWIPPFDLDQAIVPPPYTYEVFRSEGANSPELATTTTNLEFTDTGLDTRNNTYTYQVFMEDANGVRIDPSSPASSVRLDLSPLFQSIELEWSANVPWSNRSQDFPYHYIYRDNVNADTSELVLIDSVNVNESGFFYLDDGSFNNETLDDERIYCYFVTTQGVYGNEDIDEPLINRSQIFCAQPNDMIPPCTPLSLEVDPNFSCEEVLAGQACNFNDFSNRLIWTRDQSTGCDDDIRSFRIYYSETSRLEEDFQLIGEVTGTVFVHDVENPFVSLSSFKGFYRVSAVDRSGNESELSEIFENDNCPNYVLPNTFSPNGDGVNDLFTPFFETLGMPIDGFQRSN